LRADLNGLNKIRNPALADGTQGVEHLNAGTAGIRCIVEGHERGDAPGDGRAMDRPVSQNLAIARQPQYREAVLPAGPMIVRASRAGRASELHARTGGFLALAQCRAGAQQDPSSLQMLETWLAELPPDELFDAATLIAELPGPFAQAPGGWDRSPRQWRLLAPQVCCHRSSLCGEVRATRPSEHRDTYPR